MEISKNDEQLLRKVASHVPDPEYPALSQKPNLQYDDFTDANSLEEKGLLKTTYSPDGDRSAELTPHGSEVLRRLAEQKDPDWL